MTDLLCCVILFCRTVICDITFLQNGHMCGDDIDVVDGSPTGAIRISFGYMSILADAKVFLRFVNDCFVDQQVSPPSSEPTEKAGRCLF